MVGQWVSIFLMRCWWIWCDAVSEKSPIGYFLEVDLEYSDKLHELHNDYPIVPEKLAVSSAVYLVHYRNLQLYLSLEMRLTKIHGVLVLKQSDWMKKYIDFNTGKIMNAANNFEKDVFKLMINSVYVKTMKNVPKKINVR